MKSFDTASDISQTEQIIYAAIVCFSAFFHNVVLHHCVFLMFRTGQSARVACSALLYRKVNFSPKETIWRNQDPRHLADKLLSDFFFQTMTLNHCASRDVGHLMNLMSNDCTRFDYGLIFIPYLVIAPLQTLVYIYFLYDEINLAMLGGIGFVFLIMPLQGTLNLNFIKHSAIHLS